MIPAVLLPGLVIAAIVYRLLLPRIDRSFDRSSRDAIARRISEVQRQVPARQESAIEFSFGASRKATMMGPRRRLWRDSSVLLVVLGTGLAMILAISADRSPHGGVLGANATPGADPGPVMRSEGLTGPQPIEVRAWSRSFVGDELRSLSATPSPASDPGARVTSSQAPAASRRPSVASSSFPYAHSDRMRVLSPCPDHPDCFKYTVRRGDNLSSIANWFGIPYSIVLALNPQIRDPRNLYSGSQIRLPPPRR
jgi:hypothetical protein